MLELDTPVQRWWPELTAAMTLREMLAHRTGLVVLDVPAPEDAFYDWDLCRLLAAQQPSWSPGDGQGESALFYGHLLGEVVRRADGLSLGRVSWRSRRCTAARSATRPAPATPRSSTASAGGPPRSR